MVRDRKALAGPLLLSLLAACGGTGDEAAVRDNSLEAPKFVQLPGFSPTGPVCKVAQAGVNLAKYDARGRELIEHYFLGNGARFYRAHDPVWSAYMMNNWHLSQDAKTALEAKLKKAYSQTPPIVNPVGDAAVSVEIPLRGSFYTRLFWGDNLTTGYGLINGAEVYYTGTLKVQRTGDGRLVTMEADVTYILRDTFRGNGGIFDCVAQLGAHATGLATLYSAVPINFPEHIEWKSKIKRTYVADCEGRIKQASAGWPIDPDKPVEAGSPAYAACPPILKSLSGSCNVGEPCQLELKGHNLKDAVVVASSGSPQSVALENDYVYADASSFSVTATFGQATTYELAAKTAAGTSNALSLCVRDVCGQKTGMVPDGCGNTLNCGTSDPVVSSATVVPTNKLAVNGLRFLWNTYVEMRALPNGAWLVPSNPIARSATQLTIQPGAFLTSATQFEVRVNTVNIGPSNVVLLNVTTPKEWGLVACNGQSNSGIGCETKICPNGTQASTKVTVVVTTTVPFYCPPFLEGAPNAFGVYVVGSTTYFDARSGVCDAAVQKGKITRETGGSFSVRSDGTCGIIPRFEIL